MKISFLQSLVKTSKILFVILLVLPLHNLYAEDVEVTAKVWVPNKTPTIVSIAPSFSPVVIPANEVQLFFLRVQDLDWDSVSYTITPDNWAVAPLNWTITNSTNLQNGDAYINFIYLSSSLVSQLGASEIIVTLNDWINPVVVQKINIYTF